MQRRKFIAGLGSMAAWPVVARGQQRALPVTAFLFPRLPSRVDLCGWIGESAATVPARHDASCHGRRAFTGRSPRGQANRMNSASLPRSRARGFTLAGAEEDRRAGGSPTYAWVHVSRCSAPVLSTNATIAPRCRRHTQSAG
jgi:hypothetical protein